MAYTILTSWTRWRAWYPVRLTTNRKWVWLGTVIEYEQIRFPPIAGWMIGGSKIVTHYRLQS